MTLADLDSSGFLDFQAPGLSVCHFKRFHAFPDIADQRPAEEFRVRTMTSYQEMGMSRQEARDSLEGVKRASKVMSNAHL